METSETTQIYDLNEHKRKIFFERLSPKTTTDSLTQYLSKFEMDRCNVPVKDGKNRGHGIVIFRKESSVNTLMLTRPHRIDGQSVELYRSVPGQGSLKLKKGVKDLIVSGVKNKLISKLDLDRYFSGFGYINCIDMNYEEDSCRIEFDDYDAVDKAILDAPHIIKKVNVDLKKGDRNNQFENHLSSKITQATYNNNASAIPKKSIIKQAQIDPQILSMNIPKKIYRIYIKNLSSDVNAEILSKRFNWSIYNILINSPFDKQSSTIECWLKDVNELQTAEDFVEHWNGQRILGLKIECEIEEDKLELCKKFRIGKCLKKIDSCDWMHIKCTANGRCPNNCPYGHAEGLKTEYINDGPKETYQIKITGFQKKLTPKILVQTLQFPDEKMCFINPYQDRIGYIRHLKTIKYAQRLMAKWHQKEIDGQTLQCQLELSTRSPMSRVLFNSGSMSDTDVRKNDSHRRSHSSQRLNNRTRTNREPSLSSDDQEFEPRILSDREINCEGKVFSHSFGLLLKQRELDIKRKSKSTENLVSSVHLKSQTSNKLSECDKMVTNETPQDGRKMSEIPQKADGSLAFLIQYKSTYEENYHTELNALKILKGIKGVVQLIELENLLNNMKQQYPDRNEFQIITERPSGVTLKEFVTQTHRDGFGVLEAIQLVQNLITIVKQVHSKGVLHQNLEPENIMIEWNSKQTSVDQAQLTLINFSQAYIIAEKIDRIIESARDCWYKAPQANVESYKYSSTIDASNICAILLWLLTNTNPRHDHDFFPHQQENTTDKLINKITQAVRSANNNRKQTLEERELQTYVTDTFNIGFGYPEHQPWTTSDLECRLESIYELLSPRNPKLNTTDTIFQDLISTDNILIPITSTTTNVGQDMFQKASIAFQQAKKCFSDYSPHSNNQYLWSDGGCTWLDNTQISMCERRHDDILTCYSRDRHMSSNCSIIISCLASLTNQGRRITLSIGSVVKGKTSRIPIGHYSKTENYTAEFQKDFITELNRLVISICKERRGIQK